MATETKSGVEETSTTSTSDFEFPVVFMSHAAPNLFMDAVPVLGAVNDCGVGSPAYKWYQNLATQLNLVGDRRPKAIVTVTAHWISNNKRVLITAQDKHSTLYYDYYGFPKFLYDIKYPAPGSVKLAQRIKSLLEDGPHRIRADLDSKRNIDHGAFIPLSLVYPEADIPIVQVSIDSSFDPAHHVKLGESLAPLRKEGVLIIGSGQASHNAFHTFGKSGVREQTLKFLTPLTAGITYSATSGVIARAEHEAELNALGAALDITDSDEKAKLIAETKEKARHELYAAVQKRRVDTVLSWDSLPSARIAHPQEDHLVPLFACVGAANGRDLAKVVGDHWMMNCHSLRSFAWGDVGQAKPDVPPEVPASSSSDREL